MSVRPNDGTREYLKSEDPIGSALTTCHDVKASSFGLERLTAWVTKIQNGGPQRKKTKRVCKQSRTNCVELYGIIILLLSGDVESNPGPRQWKYPCTLCAKPVKSNQDGLLCDGCDMWNHLKCLPDAIRLSKENYNQLADSDENWYCYNCLLPVLSDSFFTDERQEELSDLNCNEASNVSRSDIDTDGNNHESTANLAAENSELADEGGWFDQVRSNFPKDFLISYLNVNSLRFKIHEIREKAQQADILGIAETKIDCTYPDAQFQLPGFRLYRKDRTDRGGGLVTYVRSDLPSRRLKDMELNSIESIVLEIQFNNNTRLLVAMLYRPPNSSNELFQIEMTNFLDRAYQNYDYIWLLGDLNYDMLHREKSKHLVDLCDNFNLRQLITEPTNSTIHGNTLIDVIITNCPRKCTSSGALYTGASDSHSLIYVTTSLRAPRLAKKTVTYRNYKNFQAESFIKDLEYIPTSVTSVFNDPSDNYWAYLSMVKDVVDDHAPLKTIKTRAKEVPFMNRPLKQAIRKRKRLHKRYQMFPTNTSWEKYRLQRNKCVNIRRLSIRQYFYDKCKGGAKNTNFWPTIKPFLTNKGATSTDDIMIKTDDKLLTDPQKVTDHMNDFYINITKDIGSQLEPAPQLTTETNTEYVTKCVDYFDNHPSIMKIRQKTKMSNFTFRHTSKDEVIKVIRDLDQTKATGVDRLPAKLLKLSADSTSYHFTNIFNHMVDTSIFPSDAKLAEVTPAFKKEDSLKTKNYRPISILTASSKILERLMLRQYANFLNTILDPRIAAYRQGYSCETVLFKLTEDWKSWLEKSETVGSMMVDLSKAFDCLPHKLLIAKMKAYGASTSSCALLWSYLSNRKQRVRINGVHSEWRTLSKGVPQGSIMGPALFNLFMNDIVFVLSQAEIYNYADDNSISVHAKTRNEAISRLREETKNLTTWFDQNDMEANPGKYQSIFLKDSKAETRAHIGIGETTIVSSPSVKLLGVNLDENLDFNLHTKELCRKAGAQLNVLQRLSKYLDLDSRMTIFKSFIASHFKYCSIVWHSCGIQNTNKLEKLHYRALRFVYMDFSSSYIDLLLKAELPTLETSRKRQILKEVFKSVNKLSPQMLWGIFQEKNTPYNLRSKRNLSVSHCRTTRYGLNCVSHIGAALWNQLPNKAKELKDFKDFCNYLNTWTEPECKCHKCKNGYAS